MKRLSLALAAFAAASLLPPAPAAADGADADPTRAAATAHAPPPADAQAPADVAAPAQRDAAALLAARWREADEAWAARHLPGRLDAGDAALRAADAIDPGRYETLWRRSRNLFWRADTAATDGVRRRFAREGWDAGEAAVEVRPDGVEGHYWAAVNAGIHAQAIGVIQALTSGVEGPFLAHLHFALERAPGMEDGGPKAVLGRYHYELPWPRYDGEESIRILREVVARHPRNLRAKLYLAETLLEEDAPAESLRLLEQIEKERGADPAESRLVKERAARLKPKVLEALVE